MRALVAPVLLGALVLLGLHEWKDISYWQYSEGVYALTARALVDGADVYGEVVAAQPPGVFVTGAIALAVDDSLTWLRLVIGLVQLVGALLAAVAVRRLTGSAVGAALTAPVALLLPWTVHEHGHLMPETLGTPMLLGGALLAARPGRASAAAGSVLSLAVLTKLSFALPAAAVVAAAPDRRRAAIWLGAFVAALAALVTIVFGADLWRGAVQAQIQTGAREVSNLGGYVAQAGWNLVGLLVPASAAIVLRGRCRDPDLLRVLAALSAGALLTLATVSKEGTELNVLVPIEGALLPLAVTGVIFALLVPRWRLAAPIAMAFLLAQGVGIVAGHGPFVRPFSATAYERALSSAAVRSKSAAAQECPVDTRFSGPPFIAFVADRRMPDGQPDQFITSRAEVYEDVFARMRADGPFCP
jgi:hypothetical protein